MWATHFFYKIILCNLLQVNQITYFLPFINNVTHLIGVTKSPYPTILKKII